jgi:hypothetical protein
MGMDFSLFKVWAGLVSRNIMGMGGLARIAESNGYSVRSPVSPSSLKSISLPISVVAHCSPNKAERGRVCYNALRENTVNVLRIERKKIIKEKLRRMKKVY